MTGRLLVLGGTAFVGRAIVENGVAAGWEVTTFNRGRTGADVPGVRTIHGDRWVPAAVARLADAGGWDVVIDTSGYVPANVLDVAATLSRVAERYVFMSTVSVYQGWPRMPLTEESPILEAPPDADNTFGVDVEDGPTRYGAQKAGAERAVRMVFGDSAVILRPGVVLGPRETVGRLPWWLVRIAAGGQVLAPGSASRVIQPVDARDLATFALLVASGSIGGALNVTAPGTETFGDLLEACIDATGSEADLIWVSDDRLLAADVRQWSELPLWRTYPGVWQVDASHAREAGLTCRPILDTVRATWAWLQDTTTMAVNERSSEIGIAPSKEAAILAAMIRP